MGFRPVSWQGWLVTLVALGLVLGVLALLRGSVPLAIGLALALLAADVAAWRVVSRLFDRERLIAGTRGRHRYERA